MSKSSYRLYLGSIVGQGTADEFIAWANLDNSNWYEDSETGKDIIELYRYWFNQIHK